MKSHFYLLLLLLITATTTKTIAQEFGGNPPSIKWKQIDLPAAKVIFPYGLDSAGLRVANIIRQMNGSIQPTIGFKQRQISVILQNQTTISNAYVGLAPFRSEFYLTPEQNSFELGSLSWPEQLAIHEFRHVQQYNNFNVGFSHVLKVLFGEGGQALGNDIAIPNWFFEGDAVFNETHVSEQGRGRLPFFFNGYRALWATGKDYSWMKLRNGSFRDYIPDWYPLGYMMVSYGREKYGDDFWKKVTHDAAAYKGVFFPFQKAVKRYSGSRFSDFVDSALNHFRYIFYDDKIGDVRFTIPRHFVADREFPAFVNDSTLIYMKSTYNKNPAFVINNGKDESIINTRSTSLDNYFDYHNGKIVYASFRPDVRWNYRDYSELRILDVTTGKERRITKNSKYFSPAFNADGKKIVVAQVSTSGNCDLLVLSSNDGNIINVVPNKEHLFYTYPKFYKDGQIISAVRNRAGKMSLALIDVITGDIKYLLPFSYRPIAFPVVENNTVYFSATYGIKDELFAYNISKNQLLLLDNNHSFYGEIGNYEPTLGEKKIAWVWFSADGYAIREAETAKLNWKELQNKGIQSLPDLGVSSLTRDSSTDLLAKVKNDSLPITKYRKSHNLLNFHSLIPNFVDPDYTISLAGENVLNTLQSQISFTYNRDEGYKEFGFDATYGALFPYISAGSDYFIGRRGYHNGDNIYWNETDLHGGFELPLNLSEGKNFTYLRAGSDLYYTSVNFQQPYRAHFADKAFTYLNYYLSFSNTIQQAKQNIYPRFGQSIYLNYKSAISVASSAQFLANGFLYLPGFMLNHNLVINVAHQQKNKNEVINFSNGFPFSRGYTAENLYNMNKAGVNYHFPIAYPDAGFANTFYLSRIRGNAFYDYTHVTDFYTDGRNFKASFRSTGAEIYFDAKLFNQGNISFGFRYSYLMDPDIFGGAGRSRFEIIVPVTIF